MDIDKRIAEIGEHTPGPWEVDRFKGQPPYLVTNKQDVICLFQRHERIKEKDIEANARLIALAPELLNQLKECREEIIITKLIETRLRKSWKEDTESATKRGDHKCAEIEQRTKKECFEAGWGWISEVFLFGGKERTKADFKKDFKQAIDSVEVK